MENCIENKLDPEQCPFVGVNKSSTENHAASRYKNLILNTKS